MVLPPSLISPRHQTGKLRGSAIILVGFTARSCSSEYSFSAPLAFARGALCLPRPPTPVYSFDNLCRLCPWFPVA